MLDLETFGTSRDAAIVSIGAVKFDLETFEVDPAGFHVKINPHDPKLGTIDASTVMWWLEQSEEARNALITGEKILLDQAQARFLEWLGPNARDTLLWSNGPSFDSVLLQDSFKRVGLFPWPFRYSNDRDFRTIRDIAEMTCDMEWDSTVTAHDALADAKRQAEFVVWTYKLLREKNS